MGSSKLISCGCRVDLSSSPPQLRAALPQIDPVFLAEVAVLLVTKDVKHLVRNMVEGLQAREAILFQLVLSQKAAIGVHIPTFQQDAQSNHGPIRVCMKQQQCSLPPAAPTQHKNPFVIDFRRETI
eukprot:5181665-Amphidinium_carterae.1